MKMAARENLPKIITDIQDIVSQLCADFQSYNEPITDDNQALHRLCAKLEFLLSSSSKDKSLLGNKKTYWHWIYTCLKNAKGLSDGLKYVQASKEIRSSKGRGRSFVRYCLVHQTLADSLQNCIMNQSITRQYFTPDSILINATFSAALVTSLYDLNAVNFDLNSKGYDLDAGWPTFASKRKSADHSAVDHWAIQSHVGSLASFPSASVVMDTPRMHGSGSSGPHSVDQRVEELVLELDQSDQKIKEQQQLILEMESKADSLVKSTNEKEDILARVISDLESKNRHLHIAMSDMSSEFQSREQQWSEKHDELSRKFAAQENKNKASLSKIEQLEQDKRTLEEMVSQKMSTITNSFLPASEHNSFVTPITAVDLHQSESNGEQALVKELRNKNNRLSEELRKSSERCIEMQVRLKESERDERNFSDLLEQLEQKQAKIERLEKQFATANDEHKLEIGNIKDALSLDDGTEDGLIVTEILKLRDQFKKRVEIPFRNPEPDGSPFEAESLKEENECLKLDRDVAHMDADTFKDKLKAAKLEIDQLTVELEAKRSDSTNRIRELEEALSICQQEMESQQRHHAEMLVDLKVTQDALEQSEKELEDAKQRCQQLEEKQRSSSDEWLYTKQTLEDEIVESEITIEQLQSEAQSQTSLCNALHRELEEEKSKTSRLDGDLLAAQKIADSFSKQLIDTTNTVGETESMVADLRLEVERLRSLESSHQKIISFLTQLVENFVDNKRLIDDADDLDSVTLKKCVPEKNLDATDDIGMDKWQKIGETFNAILLDCIDKESRLHSLNSEHILLLDRTESYRSRAETDTAELKEQLTEAQSKNEIHLITIKDLNDQHAALQSGKKMDQAKIETLQLEISDLQQSLERSKKAADELRLRMMDQSAKSLASDDVMKRHESDIECLKDKITQLLLDKDHLWKEGKILRDRLQEQSDALDEIEWVDDHEASSCSSCGSQFSMTFRKHHCRSCGKIFCKKCCDNWVEKDKSKVRVCNQCYMNADLDMSSISSERPSTSQTPNASSKMSISKEYEHISVEDSNIYDQSLDEVDSSGDRRNSSGSLAGEDTITLPARQEYHVPVRVDRHGVSLYWKVSSDRDINFKIGFSQVEGDSMVDVLPLRRIESHLEPFVGNLMARQVGVYTLVLDNNHSRSERVRLVQNKV